MVVLCFFCVSWLYGDTYCNPGTAQQLLTLWNKLWLKQVENYKVCSSHKVLIHTLQVRQWPPLVWGTRSGTTLYPHGHLYLLKQNSHYMHQNVCFLHFLYNFNKNRLFINVIRSHFNFNVIYFVQGTTKLSNPLYQLSLDPSVHIYKFQKHNQQMTDGIDFPKGKITG